MQEILPIFRTHYTIGSSILTCNSLGQKGPKSVFDIAKEYNLNKIYVCDNSLSGFFELYQNGEKSGIQVVFGWSVNVVNDAEQKNEESLSTQSKIIIWILNTKGYYELIKGIYNNSTTKFFYYVPRTSKKELKDNWTENLALSIPFYSGFLSKNALSFSNCIFEAPYFKAALHWESHEHPHDSIIQNAILNYNKVHNLEIVKSHSFFYDKDEDFKAFLVRRAISERSSFEMPNLEYMTSNKFSAESWKELNEKSV